MSEALTPGAAEARVMLALAAEAGQRREARQGGVSRCNGSGGVLILPGATVDDLLELRGHLDAALAERGAA